MSSVDFLAEFNAKFACSVNLLNPREFDQVGRSYARGSACATCVGCESISGEMGIAEKGFLLVRKQGHIHLSWLCPDCNRPVVEETTIFSITANVKAITTDALCHRCRTRKDVCK